LKKIHLENRVDFFNRRISREVQLLSDLNHENVVRYYNSWIETLKFEAINTDENESSKSEEGIFNNLFFFIIILIFLVQVQIVDVSHRNNFVSNLKEQENNDDGDDDEFSWSRLPRFFLFKY